MGDRTQVYKNFIKVNKVNFFILLLSLLPLLSVCSTSYITDLSIKDCVLIDQIESTNSYIGIIKIHNKLYVIRQKKNRKKGKDAWAILLSTMASKIAESIQENLLSQKVWIIPATIPFPGKYFPNDAASLHSYVSGKQVKVWQQDNSTPAEIKMLLDNFSIRLWDGLTDQVIECIARHKDLPCIVAYCLLLGYQGCHNLNIFYDDALDRFILIDMDSCFKYKNFQQIYESLLVKSYKSLCVFFQKNAKKGIKITKKEKAALKAFANSLELIMAKNPVETIKTIIVDIAKSLKTKNTSSDDQIILKNIAMIEPLLKSGYTWARKIADLIYTTFD